MCVIKLTRTKGEGKGLHGGFDQRGFVFFFFLTSDSPAQTKSVRKVRAFRMSLRSMILAY